MALSKNVDGKVIALTAEEESAARAEWAANDEAQRNAPQPVSLPERLDTIEARLAALEQARAKS